MRKYLKHTDVVEALEFVCLEDNHIRQILSCMDVYVSADYYDELVELENTSQGIDIEVLAQALKDCKLDFECACVIIFEAHAYNGPAAWINLPPIVCWLNRVYGNICPSPKQRRKVANYCKRMILD